MADTMHCYRHSDRETRVSCATCGRPICTECMRQTEVGIKCPEDAQLPRSARGGVMKSRQVAKTLLVGAGVALAGIPAAFIILSIGFGSLILAGFGGYGAGLLIHRAGGRNGGPIAMSVAGAAMVIAFAPWLAAPILSGNFNLFGILPALVAIGFAVYNTR